MCQQQKACRERHDAGYGIDIRLKADGMADDKAFDEE
jgi:hypothetical protein